MLFHTDIEDAERARKSLVASSLTVIVIANLTLLSTQAKLFGLEFAVSQQAIVTTGRIVVSFLLLAFLLRSLPGFLDRVLGEIKKVDEKWAENEHVEMRRAEEEAYTGQPPLEFEDLDPWEQFYRTERARRERRHELLLIIKSLLILMISVLLDGIFVIAIALVAIIEPTIVTAIVHPEPHG